MISEAKAGKFNIILVEALGRLSRNLGDTAGVHEELEFHGVRIFAKDTGEITRMHVAFLGMMAEQYVSDLREKTKRGQRGRTLAGEIPGGKSYGYDNPAKGIRTINEEEADGVRRIFEMYADGVSPRAIAKQLNDEGLPARAYMDGRTQPSRDRSHRIPAF